MHLTPIGSLAQQFWIEIPFHFSFIKLDAFVVMPNHIHGIIIINKPDAVATRQCLVATTFKF